MTMGDEAAQQRKESEQRLLKAEHEVLGRENDLKDALRGDDPEAITRFRERLGEARRGLRNARGALER
ncbi:MULTISPECIES: DUF1090 family protein [unclassified Streptomyces]|uniref:DUF1090 family protein n=1 Tax=Streptomyces TaxID=1883 RepID=UPI000DC7C340|nr:MULTISPECIES: DUF1090 family protein [unclassified Streptomyces]AWZ03931.1 hypothetical protein DRB89_03965 [Streptomyces sp. ICC4]AWZ13030.1 hypothetical protein DRB96_12700 [Streptomyces sp. ICC1]